MISYPPTACQDWGLRKTMEFISFRRLFSYVFWYHGYPLLLVILTSCASEFRTWVNEWLLILKLQFFFTSCLFLHFFAFISTPILGRSRPDMNLKSSFMQCDAQDLFSEDGTPLPCIPQQTSQLHRQLSALERRLADK